MAASVGSLEVSLGADIARLRKDLGRATAIAEKRARAMQNTFKKAAGVIGASFAGLSFGALIKNVADVGDRFQKLSISLGVSTEALSQYRLVAERSGTTMESLALIWQRQTRRVAEAAQGTGEARNALRELGLQASDLAKLSPDRQFEAIAEAMKGVENQSDKLRIAFKLFDSEGARPALQIMAEGAAGIRVMRKEADAMGLTMTRVQANQMATFNDRLTDAKLAISGASQQLVLSLAPSIISVAKGFAEGVKWVSKFIDSLRNVENQTNIDSLREKMVVYSEEAVRLQEQINRVGAAKGDTTQLQKQLDRKVELYQQALARIKELNKQAEEAGGAGAVGDISTEPGSLPSIADDKAAEREAAAQERMKEAMASRVEMLRESLMTEAELENARYEERLDLLEKAREQEIEGITDFDALKEKIEADHQKKLAQIRAKGMNDVARFAEAIRKKDIVSTLSGYKALIGAAASYNKTLFKINKVASIAQATISTFQGAAQALKDVPFPYNIAAAAAVVASGVAQIAQIKSTSFGGGGSGGGGGAAVSPGGAVGTFPADPVFGIPETQDRAPVETRININLGDNELFTKDAVRSLIEQINEQVDDGVVIRGIIAT